MLSAFSSALVTGGAGFIGSHLAEHLCNEGLQVIILDNLSRGSIANISHFSGKRVEFFHADVTNYDSIKNLIKEVDIVFHLAAVVGVRLATKHPLKVLNTNIESARNVLRACVESKVRKLIFASSSEVYGHTEIVPMHEDLPLSPVSPYGLSKIVGEYYVRAYSKKYGLNASIVRYFNVYGPRQPCSDKSWVVPSFITNILEGKNVVVHGSGDQTRDFTFVKDAVEGTVLVAEKGNGAGDIYNIGTGKETTINALAKLVLKLGENRVDPIHTRLRTFHIERRCADISKARKILGYCPRVGLEEGLQVTWNYFLDRLDKRDSIAY